MCLWGSWHLYQVYHLAPEHAQCTALLWLGTIALLLCASWLSLAPILVWRRYYQRQLLSMQQGERERTASAVQENAEHYRELFENASDLVYTIDMQGCLTSFNKAGERLLGYTRHEIRGMPLASLLTPESLARSQQMRANKEVGAAWTTYEVDMFAKDGRLVSLEVSSRLIKRQGQPIGIQGIARDVTARRQAEVALKKAHEDLEMRVRQRTAELRHSNEQLQREIVERCQTEVALRLAKDAADVANRTKSEFLATMSHELRTPLNGICGMTSLLLDTHLESEQREYATIVQQCSDDLLTIINDILDFSKIEAGKLALNQVDFELRPEVESVLESLAGAAHQKGLALTASIYADVPHWLTGDPGRLGQVLRNLVGNAVKFTDEGEVSLSVTLVETHNTAVASLYFAITDTGIGITPEAQEKLFQAFSQVDGSNTRKYGGTGLGLAISKRLVGLMEGEIGVESLLGHGSTFWFTARFAPCAPDKHAAPKRALPADLRVLVADSQATSRAFLASLLRAWGAHAEAIEEEAPVLPHLQTAARAGCPYNVVLLDAQLATRAGPSLARALARDPHLASTAVVLLTPLGQPAVAAHALHVPLSVSLAKPLRQALLYECLSTIHQRGATAPAVASPRPQRTLPQVNATVLVVEDNLVNQKVLVRMLERYGCKVDVALNGAEAVSASARIAYACIFMDCQMPGMDGYAATQAIRQREAETGHHLPIIAMTASAMSGDRERCLAAGMDTYLAKPATAEAILAVLQHWTSLAAS